MRFGFSQLGQSRVTGYRRINMCTVDTATVGTFSLVLRVLRAGKKPQTLNPEP